MKKSALLLAIMMLVPSFACAESLLPLQTVLSVGPEPAAQSTLINNANQYVQANSTESNVNNGVYEASYITPNQLETDPNMIPQNAAAKGEPVAVERKPRVRIRTKQRSQGNSYWNAGGKGWRSYY